MNEKLNLYFNKDAKLKLLDDLKIEVRPKFRLFIMIIFLLILLIYNEFEIERISLEYLKHKLEDRFAFLYMHEGIDLAKFESENPQIIRIICKSKDTI